MLDSVLPLLSPLFDRPKTEEFWHYVAKKKSSQNFYDKKEELEVRVEEIRKKLGSCDFDRQESEYRWTPLHVAVIVQNAAAIKFFLSKMASFWITDVFEKTPCDYILTIPSLYSVFKDQLQGTFFAHSLSDLIKKRNKVGPSGDSALLATLSPLFKRVCAISRPQSKKDFIKSLFLPPRALPERPFRYDAASNDFGIVIRELIFAQRCATFLENHFTKNMKAIAEQEGFQLCLTNEDHCYPRDHFLRINQRDVLLLGFPLEQEEIRKSIKVVKETVQKMLSYNAYFEEGAQFQARICCFAGKGGGAIMFKSNAAKDYRRFFPLVCSIALYLEGGNILTLTNSQGKKKVLIGNSELLQSHVQLRLSKCLEIKKNVSDNALSKEEICRVVEEMYALGFIRLDFGKGKMTGFLSEETISEALRAFYDEERKSFRSVAVEKGFITPIKWNDELIESARGVVSKYLLERAVTKEALATVFKVPLQDLHFVTQFAYHLDIFIQSGPKGSLFLQDFGCCADVLQKMVEAAPSLGLEVEECAILGRHLETAGKLHKALGSSLVQTRKELESAGFIVIPTPGVFYDQQLFSDARSYHFNFLNAITGWSFQKEHYFYITAGAQIGEHLGSLFMDFFTAFMQQYVPGLKLYFTGENPEKKGDFSQAMMLWNQIEEGGKLNSGVQAGVHCMSFEKETESFTAVCAQDRR